MTYTITSHEYTEIIACDDPSTCTRRSHWDIVADDVTAEDIATWVEVNDHPATRVTEQQD